MKAKIIYYFKYFFFIFLGLALVWWQLSDMTNAERNEFFQTIRKIKFGYLPIILIAMFLGHWVRAIRWKILMRPLNYNPPVWKVFSAIMTGYAANSAVPRLGEFIRCKVLSDSEHLHTETLVGTVVVERMVDLLSQILVIAAAFIFQFEIVSRFFNKQEINSNNHSNNWLFFLIGIIIISIFIFYFFKKFPQSKIVLKTKKLFAGFKAGISSIVRLKEKTFPFIVLTILMWGLYFLQIFLAFKTIAGTEHLMPNAALTVLALATIGMIITPGGLGAFPLFVARVLSLYGISTIIGKALGWTIWGANTILTLVAGIICYFALIKYRKPSQLNYEQIKD